MRTIEIGGAPVGDGHPCYVIAEAGCNHNKSLDLAKQLVDMSADAKSDAVKFQTFTADTIVSSKAAAMEHISGGSGKSITDLFRELELPTEFHKPIAEHCHQRGIPFMSSVFYEEGVALLEELKVPAYKIASFEIGHLPLLREVARTGKPIVLSTGMATLCDIERALNTLSSAGNDEVVLLHCVSNYPAKPEDYNLRVVQSLKATFDLPVGVSDHTPGIEMPKISVAAGADMIEKHITTDQSLPGPDHSFSVDPAELTAMIEAIRAVEAMLGSPRKRRLDSEHEMAVLGRRSLVAKQEIPAGGEVTDDMIAVKRPGSGIEPYLADVIVGRKVRRAVAADEPFVWDMFLE